jgi:hypothetical protein
VLRDERWASGIDGKVSLKRLCGQVSVTLFRCNTLAVEETRGHHHKIDLTLFSYVSSSFGNAVFVDEIQKARNDPLVCGISAS